MIRVQNQTLRRYAATLLVLVSAFGGGRVYAAGGMPVVLREMEEQCQQRHAALQDLTIVTEFIIHAPNGDMKSVHLIREKGKRLRVDIFRSGDAANNSERQPEFVGISDDRDSWTISRAGERHSQGSAINQQDPNFLCWQFTEENAKITGDELLRGQDCFVVEVQVKHTVNRLWLDKESHFVLQREEVPPTGAVTRWVSSNFHTATGDLKIPQKTDMFVGDQLMATVIVQSVTFNTGLGDDLFDPEKVKLDLSGQ